MVTVKIRFLPDDVTTTATVGEPLLAVAARAGVYISTGCLMGSCHACEVSMTGEEEPVLACLKAIPPDLDAIKVELLDDPTW
ncbi:MAG: 2Fe-2S iron-sulfur cluster-binding protein [Phormidesmis sp.]